MVQFRCLTSENAAFFKTPGGMLAAEIDGERCDSVYLHCSFPHSHPDQFISVRTDDHKELGIIRSLDVFPDSVQELLQQYIQIRYYTPKIRKVVKVEEEFGYSYWETETESGVYRFTVRSGSGNVKMITDQKLLITDVDGNRFMIENIAEVSEKEFRMIEMCM